MTCSPLTPLGRIVSVLSSTLRSSSAKKAALDLIVVASRVGYAVLSFLPGSPARLALHRHIPSLALFYIPVARYRSNLNQSARSENDSIWREVQSSLSITLREAEVYSAGCYFSPPRRWLLSLSVCRKPLMRYFENRPPVWVFGSGLEKMRR